MGGNAGKVQRSGRKTAPGLKSSAHKKRMHACRPARMSHIPRQESKEGKYAAAKALAEKLQSMTPPAPDDFSDFQAEDNSVVDHPTRPRG